MVLRQPVAAGQSVLAEHLKLPSYPATGKLARSAACRLWPRPRLPAAVGAPLGARRCSCLTYSCLTVSPSNPASLLGVVDHCCRLQHQHS
eukprot:12201953-Alexandrium_andersonii.AAC.1